MGFRSLALFLGLMTSSARAAEDVKITLTFKLDETNSCPAGTACDLSDLTGVLVKTLSDGKMDSACPTSSITTPENSPDLKTQFVVFTCGGGTKEQRDQIVLLASTPEIAEAAAKAMQEAINSQAAASRIPNILKFQLKQTTATANFPVPKTLGLALTGYKCGSFEKLMAGLAKVLKIDKKTVSGEFVNLKLKKVVKGVVEECATAGRRLLAGDLSLEYALPGLSTGQLSLVNAALGDGAFSRNLVTQLGPDAGSPSVTMTNPDGSALTDIPRAAGYTPEESATNMHNFARLQGTNNVIDLAGDNSMDYLMGLILMAGPCFFCFAYSMNCFCCHVICCRCFLNNKKRYQGIMTPAMLISVIFLFFSFIGWAIFSKSASSFTDMKEGFVSGGNQIVSLLTNLGNSIDKFSANGILIKAELEKSKYSQCSTLTALKGPLSIAQTNPLAGLPIGTIESGINLYDTNNIIFVMAIVVLTGLYFAMAICQAISTYLQIRQSNSCKCLQCCAKCSICCAPCSIISMWIGGAICIIFSGLLGDICYKDPLQGFADLPGFEAMGYFLTCKGAPPQALVDIFVMVGSVATLVDNIDGLTAAAKADADCDYPNTINDADLAVVKGLVSGQGNLVLDIAKNMVCSTMNGIGKSFISDGICHGMQPAMYFSWLGCLFMAFSLMATTMMYVRVMNTNKLLGGNTGGKVVPQGVEVAPRGQKVTGS